MLDQEHCKLYCSIMNMDLQLYFLFSSSVLYWYFISVHIHVFQIDIFVSFSICCSFFCTPQPSPSPSACEALTKATPPINRPRPVPVSSTLNTLLSPLSLQACALHTSAAPFYQVPAWCGFQCVIPNRRDGLETGESLLLYEVIRILWLNHASVHIQVNGRWFDLIFKVWRTSVRHFIAERVCVNSMVYLPWCYLRNPDNYVSVSHMHQTLSEA